MEKLTVRLLIALITFVAGVTAATLWLVRHHPPKPTPALVSAPATVQPAPPLAPASGINHDEGGIPSGQGRPAMSIEKEWRELVNATFCFNGSQYYSPEQELASSNQVELAPGGGFSPGDWLASVKRDEGAAVEFLINQIPDKRKTRAHVCPLDNATRGELAVYCLQRILKVNWPELSEDYSRLFDRKPEGVTSQSLLRGAISGKKGAQKMMSLWRGYFENGRRE